jgi:hypothetical protein
LEDILFSHDRTDSWLKQNNFIETLERVLTRSKLLDISGSERRGSKLIVDLKGLIQQLERIPLGSRLSQKVRKRIISRFRSLTEDSKDVEFWKAIALIPEPHRHVIFGVEIQGVRVIWIKDWNRWKHIMGLADAVSLSLDNMNIRVHFPMSGTHELHHHHTVRKRWFQGNLVVSRGQLKYRTSDHVYDRTRFSLILHYLRVFPKKVEEKEYVKRIKLSLAGTFSLKMGQDLPPEYQEKQIPLFPKATQKKLDRILFSKKDGRRKLRCQFYFNLLQSKSLCAPVGQDMIDEAYRKHRASLCRPEEDRTRVPENILKDLFEYGQRVGDRVAALYDPFSTSLPNSRSSIESNRQNGGNRAGLVENGTLKSFSGHPLIKMMSDDQSTRLEPFVIGLFGIPGSGKTTLTQELVEFFRRRICPGWQRSSAVYSRNCGTKHWDGYNGQPIVVLDDFGQDLSSREDLVEFETLVSINDYVLPMADLKEKGQKFRSPIIILTSNMQFASSSLKDGSGSPVMEDPVALWRRINAPFLIDRDRSDVRRIFPIQVLGRFKEEHQDEFYCEKYLRGSGGIASLRGAVPQPRGIVLHRDHHDVKWREAMERLREHSSVIINRGNYSSLEYHPSVSKVKVMNDLYQSLRDRWSYHQHVFSETWEQVVSSKKVLLRPPTDGSCRWDLEVEEDPLRFSPFSRTLQLNFPTHPPSHPPIVKAHAIEEPLKVRMITLGEVDTKVLQPFQKALWQYLSEQPQFCLTNGVKSLEDFELETLPWLKKIEHQIKRILEESRKREQNGHFCRPDHFPSFLNHLEGIQERIALLAASSGRNPRDPLLDPLRDLTDEDNERFETLFSYLNYSDDSKEFWLSGDYTAATDNFPMEVTEALVEGILSRIDHEPTKRWVRWEISPHEMRYPDGTDKQTSGQLMGSLLSFPLLCFLNDYIVSSSGFEPGSYLVNGDDVVARGNLKRIRTWALRAPKVGLGLSLGKNFVDDRFCTVNSQLFYEGELQTTGKVSTQTREGNTLSHCFSESQFHWGLSSRVMEIFLKRNFRVLSKTPRSLCIHREKGGLGLCTIPSRVDMRLAKKVYLYDFLHRFGRYHAVPGGGRLGLVPIPLVGRSESFDDLSPDSTEVLLERLRIRKEMEERRDRSMDLIRSLDINPPNAPAFDDLTHRELSCWWENLRDKDPDFFASLKNFCDSGKWSINDLPRLGLLDVQYRIYPIEVAKQVARLVRRELFRLLEGTLEDDLPEEYDSFWIPENFLSSVDEELTWAMNPVNRLFNKESEFLGMTSPALDSAMRVNLVEASELPVFLGDSDPFVPRSLAGLHQTNLEQWLGLVGPSEETEELEGTVMASSLSDNEEEAATAPPFSGLSTTSSPDLNSEGVLLQETSCKSRPVMQPFQS